MKVLLPTRHVTELVGNHNSNIKQSTERYQFNNPLFQNKQKAISTSVATDKIKKHFWHAQIAIRGTVVA